MLQNSVKLSGIVLEAFCFPRTASTILNIFSYLKVCFPFFSVCFSMEFRIITKISDLTLQLHLSLSQLILARKCCAYKLSRFCLCRFCLLCLISQNGENNSKIVIETILDWVSVVFQASLLSFGTEHWVVWRQKIVRPS